MAVADTARLIAALELQDKFSATAAKYERTLGSMETKTSTLGRIGAEASRGASTAITNIARIGVFAGGAAAVGIGKAVQAASDLQQAAGAAESILGDSVGTLKAWGDQAAEAAGLSRREVLQTGAVLSAQLQAMNFDQDEAAEHTVELQKRAADLAATFGGPTSDALIAISALLRGERDPIEKYGVSLKQVDINARVVAKGLDTSTTQAKKNSEAIAALELLMEQTARTEGQFSRETDTLAGAQSRFKANLENTGATIGTVLLPQLSKLTGRFNDLLKDNQPAIQAFAERLPDVFDRLEKIVMNLPWGAIGSTFELMGTGADALLTAFTSMPDWVQTAVLTGWGVNKLTGGALGNIVGELGKGLIKGVLGMNAAVVNINAGVVNGGGGPTTGPAPVGSKGFDFSKLLGWAARGGLGAAIIATAGSGPVSPELQATMDDFRDEQRATTDGISAAEASIVRELEQARASLPNLEESFRSAMEQKIARLESQLIALRSEQSGKLGGLLGATSSMLGKFNSIDGKLGGILAKNPVTNVNVTTPITVQVGVSEIQYRVQSLRTTIGGGGFI